MFLQCFWNIRLFLEIVLWEERWISLVMFLIPDIQVGFLFPGLNETPLFLHRSLDSGGWSFIWPNVYLFGFAYDLKLS